MWLDVNQPKLRPSSKSQQHILKQGHQIGAAARSFFDAGELVHQAGQSLEFSIKKTKHFINNNSNVLFEAAFEFNGIQVVSDIIVRLSDDSWQLIEVKSGLKAKYIHVEDLSLQALVLQNNGLDISNCSVMHLNRDCIYPNLDELFYIEDVTDRIIDSKDVGIQSQEFSNIINLQHAPEYEMDKDCKGCDYFDHCWPNLRGETIFDIPRVSDKLVSRFEELDIVLLKDIPEDFKLTETQAKFVSCYKDKSLDVDCPAIKEALSELTYPIYFFDFETHNPAIPFFEGQRPYQQIPFQYSCHILYQDGTVEHREFLHLTRSDPQEHLALQLIKDLGCSGSIVAYNASFEKGVISRLAELFPDIEEILLSFNERFWDQFDIFKNHYRDHRFGGSNSIKKVLPVLVPELSYQSLDVQKGEEAQAAWEFLISCEDDDEKDRLANALREYCKLDTLAMLEIHKVLEAL